jgi:nicotinamide-nucleotide amidase
MTKPLTLPALAQLVLIEARAQGRTIATAESCTGGLVAAALTDIAGSSDVFERAFISYSNAAKTEMLGVPATLIAQHGAVSREVAAAMAEGALARAKTGLAVAITGIAGPGGGSSAKPVGLVHFAALTASGAVIRIEKRYNPTLSRAAIRKAATRESLRILLLLLRDQPGEPHFA